MMTVRPEVGSIQQRTEAMGLSIAGFVQVCWSAGVLRQGRIRRLKRTMLTDAQVASIQGELDAAKAAEDAARNDM